MDYAFEAYFIIIVQLLILILLIVLICKSYIKYKDSCIELHDLEITNKKGEEKEKKKRY